MHVRVFFKPGTMLHLELKRNEYVLEQGWPELLTPGATSNTPPKFKSWREGKEWGAGVLSNLEWR